MAGAPSDAHDERAALAESFQALGPGAPTILPGWDAAELLEHLLVRERYPHRMIGATLPGPWGRRSREVLGSLRAMPWPEQVALLRTGPPSLLPIGAMDRLSGNAELLIHHEDLLRAQDHWSPRVLPRSVQAQAWRAAGLMAHMSMSVAADVTVVSPLGGRQLRSRRSAGGVRVHGEPLELLLWVTGRDRVARVRIHGDPDALAALQEGRRGL